MARRLPRRWTVVFLVLAAGCTNSSESANSPQNAGAALPEQAARGAWRKIAAPSIPPAGGMAAAWTGRQLVVWGGQSADGEWRASGAGAAYDPATDRWTVLPPAPLAGRFGATATWTGAEVLFWGGQEGPDVTFANGAAYDPVNGRWRILPPAPIGGRTGHQAVWTGDEMIVWGGLERCCPIDSVIHDDDAAAYDPAGNRWRRIAAVPPPWSGDDGTAVTTADGNRALIWRRNHLAVLDAETEEWRKVAGSPPPLLAESRPLPSTTADPFAVGTFADHEFLTWTGPSPELRGVAWRSTDGRWRRTATLEAQAGASLTAADSGRIFAAAGQSARVLEYRVADDAWEELPLPPVTSRSAAVLVWTGSELLFWGGIGDEGPELDGAAWRPGD